MAIANPPKESILHKPRSRTNWGKYSGAIAQVLELRYEVPLGTFEQMTGLSLTFHEGGMKIDLPPLRQFFNRLLAVRIDMQNVIFQRFELLLKQQSMR
ncbi:strawberry notch C-terminal domain-containing protein [Nostoc sp. C117]|uniref:strawberry notch C-terminal domain-containing protein n=1 Tax=Nostoc sp. C117 TaxID=3349875 RepID=UPI00370DB5F8